ncbi:hypothetical protein [Ramlibacter sp.]|uniref:hypothetical protein n=1 Tax=Ramlibacter sp. TaxID=1917967 RepID=UPI002CAC62F3|nr:hypothetical protein [Ramlibacter sp.]HWI83392.1 hypothetical protein [Ramlibacter sp.]
MKTWRSLLLAAVAAGASWQALACYTVYDSANRVIHRSSVAPVDMSRPLHQTVPQRFPGGQLVFDHDTSCQAVVPPAAALRARSAGSAPLLTDRSTAEAMGLRYSALSRDIVLVAPQQAAVAVAALPARPVVVPQQTVARAAANARPATVITELRDPPVTIVERPDGVTVSALTR